MEDYIVINFDKIAEIENKIQQNIFAEYKLNSGEIEFILREMLKGYVKINDRLHGKVIQKFIDDTKNKK